MASLNLRLLEELQLDEDSTIDPEVFKEVTEQYQEEWQIGIIRMWIKDADNEELDDWEKEYDEQYELLKQRKMSRFLLRDPRYLK